MKAELKTALKEAMKAQDKLRMETIRSILSDIQYEEMQKGVDDLPANDIVAVVQRASKKRQEEIQSAEQANRMEMKEKAAAELVIVEAFLPKQLSAAELEKVITGWKDSTPGLNMGVAMKMLKEQFGGQYDGKTASDVAKRVLG